MYYETTCEWNGDLEGKREELAVEGSRNEEVVARVAKLSLAVQHFGEVSAMQSFKRTIPERESKMKTKR